MMYGLIHFILIRLENQILSLFVLFLETIGENGQVIRRTLITMTKNKNVPDLFVYRF
jgi:hypothetical protein